LLSVEVSEQAVPGLSAFNLASTDGLGNGEKVNAIGSRRYDCRSVDSGNLMRIEGRDLVISGMIKEGDSGGRSFLMGGYRSGDSF